ncbi:hypothetical protein [Nonomuraea sp. NPDC050202]|jgi:hypothetical protein|uniref:hypothetical protein n=1 Tax=Nonomuraea sp. NPDC050202 TaxID=3155035 RepID=UPI0034103F2E
MSLFITDQPSRPRAIDDTPASGPESISAGAVRRARLGPTAGTLTGAVTSLMVRDLCRPLSMLGMAAISVKLAFAARRRGVIRWRPLVATRPEPVRS